MVTIPLQGDGKVSKLYFCLVSQSEPVLNFRSCISVRESKEEKYIQKSTDSFLGLTRKVKI